MRGWTGTTRTLAVMVMLLALGATAVPAADDGERQARIDINTATAEELASLPGVGPAIAARIVAFRDEHGPFRRVEDLMKVRGIGEKSFEKLKSRVTVGASR